MPKDAICSYTRETGAPKTYEDSSWSTRTEIILVKTRCTAIKPLPDSSKTPSKISNASSLSLGQELFEELPSLRVNKKAGRRRMAWGRVENKDSEWPKDIGTSEKVKSSSDQLFGLWDRHSRTSNFEAWSKLNCKDAENDPLSRPSTAMQIYGKSRSVDKPKELQSSVVDKARRKSTSNVRSSNIITPHCSNMKGDPSLTIEKEQSDSLPSIALGKSLIKSLHQTDRRLNHKLHHRHSNLEQVNRKLEHIKFNSDIEAIDGGCRNISAERLELRRQRYSTGNYPLLGFRGTENNSVGLTLVQSASANVKEEATTTTLQKW